MTPRTPPPVWQAMPMRCLACHVEWEDWQPSGVPAAVWIASIEGLSCPSCGAGYRRLAFNLRPNLPEEPRP